MTSRFLWTNKTYSFTSSRLDEPRRITWQYKPAGYFYFLRTVLVVYLSVPFYWRVPIPSCLKLYAPPPPLTSLICEIKTHLILWKYQVILVITYIFIIKVINYALCHTFESKLDMYFHNKTWYTCTRCYM